MRISLRCIILVASNKHCSKFPIFSRPELPVNFNESSLRRVLSKTLALGDEPRHLTLCVFTAVVFVDIHVFCRVLARVERL